MSFIKLKNFTGQQGLLIKLYVDEWRDATVYFFFGMSTGKLYEISLTQVFNLKTG